jgi:hypothetical protein
MQFVPRILRNYDTGLSDFECNMYTFTLSYRTFTIILIYERILFKNFKYYCLTLNIETLFNVLKNKCKSYKIELVI